MFLLLYLVTFLGFLGFDYAIPSVYLENNPWVRDIKEMSWGYFKPMYWTWLFYCDRKGWVKYSTVLGCIFTPILVIFWSLIFRDFVKYPRMTLEVFTMGSAFGTILMIFSLLHCILLFFTIYVIDHNKH
jgi:hypothetical protein